MTDLLLKGIARIQMTTKAIFTLYRRAFRADTKGYPAWYQWTPFRYAILPFKRSARRSLASFPYDPTTATSIKSSLKDRLRILFNHFAIILSRSVTKKKETFFLELMRGGWTEFRQRGRIYRCYCQIFSGFRISFRTLFSFVCVIIL